MALVMERLQDRTLNGVPFEQASDAEPLLWRVCKVDWKLADMKQGDLLKSEAA